MSILSAIGQWLASLFRSSPAPARTPEEKAKPEAPILFFDINVVSKPPRNDQIAAGQFYCVVSANKQKWSLFRCPCGCGDVITLSLQPIHRPHWRLTQTHSGRPTMNPSVWRDKGCLSHFWVQDGRVSWCYDTGNHPDIRQHREWSA